MGNGLIEDERWDTVTEMLQDEEVKERGMLLVDASTQMMPSFQNNQNQHDQPEAPKLAITISKSASEEETTKHPTNHAKAGTKRSHAKSPSEIGSPSRHGKRQCTNLPAISEAAKGSNGLTGSDVLEPAHKVTLSIWKARKLYIIII